MADLATGIPQRLPQHLRKCRLDRAIFVHEQEVEVAEWREFSATVATDGEQCQAALGIIRLDGVVKDAPQTRVSLVGQP
jgi:hypothetical protein